jgi:hypothetical protein
MPDPRWHFQTTPKQRDTTIRYEWCWRAVSVDATVMSARSFASLAECVADAIDHGFTGTVQMPSGFPISTRITGDRGSESDGHAGA